MKILSLFDGMACGYEALMRAGIKIDKYYASEIDKYAIQIALKNHPNIIEIGDVCNVKGEDYQDIDLLIGGSPCQGFSVAGKMLNFNDPRSKLFFEYVRILREAKPKYFLLENVKMKKEWVDIISRELGVQPIEINSSLVSAQNRRRLYRTNIPSITQPKDKGILLKDILEENVDEKYYYSADRWNRIINGSYDILKRLEDKDGKCATLVTTGGGNHEKKIASDLVYTRGGELRVRQATKQGYIVAEKGDGISLAYPNSTTRRGRVTKGKSATLTTQGDCHVVDIPQTVRVRKYEVDTEKLKTELRNRKWLMNLSCKEIADELGVPQTKVEHRFRTDNSFAIPDEDIRFRLKKLLKIHTYEFDKAITEFEEREGVYEKSERKISVEGKMTTLTTSGNDEIYYKIHQQDLVQSSEGKARCLVAGHHGNADHYTKTDVGYGIRKLTPIECERLQTLPDNYTEGVSNSQRYKMLGNGWTVDVIAHIFSFIK